MYTSGQLYTSVQLSTRERLIIVKVKAKVKVEIEMSTELVVNIDKLIELNSQVNGGAGLSIVHNIIAALKLGDIKAANNEWIRDGDKIPSYGEYKKIQQVVIELLGCRLHLTKNCQRPFCRKRS